MSITNFCEPVVKSCHACEKKGNEMNFSGLAKKKKKLTTNDTFSKHRCQFKYCHHGSKLVGIIDFWRLKVIFTQENNFLR